MGVAVMTPRRRRDWSSFTAHAILIASVAVLAFPLYYAIVISTQTASQATTLPPRLLPSTAMFQNYAEAWHRAQMGRLLFNSAVMAPRTSFG
jgi:ABC-type glycerol-3-phosphate transport system permease component